MKLLHRGFIYESVMCEATELSPSLLSWFGDSKVVDSEGKPKRVYHGTTHDFEVFKKSKFVNFIKGGIYFTDSPQDAAKNYASGEGGDSKTRIRNLVDSIKRMPPAKVEKLLGGQLTNQPQKSLHREYIYSIVDDMKITKYAENKILGENPAPNIMPVYLKITNPFTLDENSEVYKLAQHPDAPHNTVNVINDGSVGYKLIASLANECKKNNVDWRDLVIEITRTGSFDGLKFLGEIVRYSPLGTIFDTKPFFANILKNAGFDGVIMAPALYFFGNYGDVYHYMVFNPNQIKSVFNANPTKNTNITKEE